MSAFMALNVLLRAFYRDGSSLEWGYKEGTDLKEVLGYVMTDDEKKRGELELVHERLTKMHDKL